LLSHPLVLLAAGALLSGILVPAFTRQWQNHAKELDVKADLVKQINASVLPVFDAYRQVETTYARESAVGAADRAYVKWYEGRYAVSDNIDAYFRNAKKLNAAWENFNSSLIGASILLTEPRYFRANWIARKFPAHAAALRPLATCEIDCRDPRWSMAFAFLENLLHQRKLELVHELLAARSVL
jgi:hypothetical protein